MKKNVLSVSNPYDRRGGKRLLRLLNKRVSASQRDFVIAQNNRVTIRTPWKSIAAVAFGLLLSVPGMAQAQYIFTNPIDVPGATRTAANGNSTNEIVGEFDDTDGNTHGFLFNGGAFTKFDAPGASATVIGGINAPGQFAGSYVDGTGRFHAFFDKNGEFFTVDPDVSIRTVGFFVNAQGQVVGTYRDATNKRHGFIWRNGAFTLNINFPNDADPLGTSAVGINDVGEVVGTYVDKDSNRHGFLRSSKGDFARFDVPGADFTVGQGINNAGTIGGLYVDGSGTHGFVLKNSVFDFITGVLKSGVFVPVDVPGAQGTEVFSINAKGEIVGDYSDSKGGHGFLGVPAPGGRGLTLDPGVTSEGASKGVIFR
jgi:probable HAF family extracellular repeat protein